MGEAIARQEDHDREEMEKRAESLCRSLSEAPVKKVARMQNKIAGDLAAEAPELAVVFADVEQAQHSLAARSVF